jgi:hypothetical protein
MCGCVHTYEVPESDAAGPKLEPNASYYVAMAAPGRFNATIYEASGAMTTRAVAAALAPYAARVETGAAAGTLDEAIEQARDAGARYLVVPTILHWEDRATEWSGKSDRIRIRLEIVDAKSGAGLLTREIAGKSRWATLGGDHPQDLLAEPIGRWVQAVVPARIP